MLANRGMDEGDVPRIYNGALLMHKKEQNCFIFRDMDRLRDPHTEGGESERVEQIPYLCMYVLSLQLCPTLCDPMDCSPPGSFVHDGSPGKNTGVGFHALLQGIFLTQESNPCILCFLRWQMSSLSLGPPEKSPNQDIIQNIIF